MDMFWIDIFIISHIFVMLVTANLYSEEKRILLSDPSYVQQQLEHLQAEIQDLRVDVNLQKTNNSRLSSTIESLKHNILALQNTGRGTNFIRWGRQDCPGNFSMVYSGYAAGSWYIHTGAAAEYVCLPPDPIWGPDKDATPGNPGHSAYIYGSEYEDPNVFHQGRTIDVPCTVCQSLSHSMTLMIPGRTECYSDWAEAYRGDLAAGHYDHKAASQYVCVDQHPQALAGGGGHDDDGKLFYGVRVYCGSLKCPPYESDKQLSCVVCVK